MSEVFGPGPFLTATVPASATAQGALDDVVQRLKGLRPEDPGGVALGQAVPTAAFSRRDTLLPGYTDARTAVTELGFAPAVRPVGGHLAVYDGGSLVLHLWGPHDDPRAGIGSRFVLLGETLASALRHLGVDARLGPVPGEYCDGKYSVNAGGVTKLVGTGQRIVRGGFLFSAVVMVQAGPAVTSALAAAYSRLALELEPRSIGGVADFVPGATTDDVSAELLTALRRLLPSSHVPHRPEPALPRSHTLAASAP